MRLTKFVGAFWAAALLCSIGSGSAVAQEPYPARPVRIIVGLAPGSAADLAARVLAQHLSQSLGQQFLVESRPGAGSNIGTEAVVRAPKDGYTLLLGTVANTINATLSSNLSFDFAKDLAPIALFATLPNILVVHPSTGVTAVPQLVALAKSSPGKLFFGSSGVGTSPHLSGELFNTMAGVKLVHVPYQGSAQAVTDLLAGRVQVMFSPASTILQHVQEQKLVALASTQLKRASSAPDLPTMSEAGMAGFDTGVWFGLMAPAGTPADAIGKLSNGVNSALQSADVLSALQKLGMDPLGGTAEEFARYIEAETKKWADVAAAAGLKK
jgi:tripartite-type tricarboxylate transporter receptor subunit TctC